LTDVGSFADIEPVLGRGSAMADYDNDGDLDLAINSIGSPLVLLRNDNDDGHWLEVGFEEFSPGATVSIILPNGQELKCESKAGSSYLSSEDPRCHFGLGMADKVIELLVQWPGGLETRMSDVNADQYLTVSKDEAQVSDEQAITTEIEDFAFEVLLKDGGAKPLTILPESSPELIELGEALFWDKELSGNRDVACVTCHHPLAGTGDDLSLSIGVGGTGFAAERQLGHERDLIPRNAPEIYNRGAVGWETMFWDGRISQARDSEIISSPAGAMLPDGLDNVVAAQAMFPVTSREEMRGDIGDVDVFGEKNELASISDRDLRAIWSGIMERLLNIPEYQRLFSAAYPDIPLEWLGFYHAANAIAAYEMSVFTHSDSPWDRFLAGEEDALTSEARRGATLFFGEAGCSNCHNGSLLTDQTFHNIGVPQLGPGKGDDVPMDHGREGVTGNPVDLYAFRTPPLRNVAITGPWMHNGAYNTLEAAVRHHLNPEAALANFDVSSLDPIIQATVQEQSNVLANLDPLMINILELTDEQVDDLLSFLHALTSPSALKRCDLIPDSVPSGLPLEIPHEGICP
jgi:cytochrome c peroxidase